jgi:hypothetical protein
MRRDITTAARELVSSAGELLKENDLGFYSVKWEQTFREMLEEKNIWDTVQSSSPMLNSDDLSQFDFMEYVQSSGYPEQKNLLTGLVSNVPAEEIIIRHEALKKGAYTGSLVKKSIDFGDIGNVTIPDNTSPPVDGGLLNEQFKTIFLRSDTDALVTARTMLETYEEEQDSSLIPDFLKDVFRSPPPQRDEAINPFDAEQEEEQDRLGKY